MATDYTDFLGEPVAKFDPNASDQYELKCDTTNTTASLNLLAILQSRKMEVAELCYGGSRLHGDAK